MTETSTKIRKLLICCCVDYQLTDRENIRRLYAAAVNAGVGVELCADLCLEVISHPERLKTVSASDTTVAACYPRAVNAFFTRTGVSAPDLIDIRHQSVEDILEQAGLAKAPAVPSVALPVYENEWKAWFPVIDVDRCSRCGECVDFCFFGVYERNGSEVRVASPRNCKTNCPACARMCPSRAIIFPKHTDAPINGGDISPEDTSPGETETKFDERLYQRLAQRRRAQKKNSLLQE